MVTEWNKSPKATVSRAQWRTKNPKHWWAIKTCGEARKRAAKKGLPFDITPKYIASIIPETCPVFGFPLSLTADKVIKYSSPTLDRLIPAQGYVEGNVVVISMKANAIKSAYGASDVLTVGRWMQYMGL